jgi:hypothetical protein
MEGIEREAAQEEGLIHIAFRMVNHSLGTIQGTENRRFCFSLTIKALHKCPAPAAS